MKILLLDTSTDACSVALGHNNDIIAYRENREGKSHAKLLTVYIEEVLREADLDVRDLDAVSVGKGPGSYTGLRIGVSTAKGICYGNNIPLLSITTLEILVHYAFNNSDQIRGLHKKGESFLICPMVDARRMEVYTSLFNENLEQKEDIKASIIGEEYHRDLLDKQKIFYVGNGALKCEDTIKHHNAVFIKDILPRASAMLETSVKYFNNKKFEDVAYFEPFYLKDFVATKSKKDMLNT